MLVRIIYADSAGAVGIAPQVPDIFGNIGYWPLAFFGRPAQDALFNQASKVPFAQIANPGDDFDFKCWGLIHCHPSRAARGSGAFSFF